MRVAIWVVIGVSAVPMVGCRARPAAAPAPPPMTVAGTPTEGVSVALLWSAPVDLDLYVTDPSLETVYFANPRSQSGGRLKQDVTCTADTRQARLESAAWPSPPKGLYRVGVD